jgi:hypothetical protein
MKRYIATDYGLVESEQGDLCYFREANAEIVRSANAIAVCTAEISRKNKEIERLKSGALERSWCGECRQNTFHYNGKCELCRTTENAL